MSKICVRVQFEMEEEGRLPTLLITNDETVAKRFYEAVAKVIVVGDADAGAGSPRYFMFHEEKAIK